MKGLYITRRNAYLRISSTAATHTSPTQFTPTDRHLLITRTETSPLLPSDIFFTFNMASKILLVLSMVGLFACAANAQLAKVDDDGNLKVHAPFAKVLVRPAADFGPSVMVDAPFAKVRGRLIHRAAMLS